jgi:predicted house-cleaning noncanonical NTP pyrophosphatase (MazG superfamily)
MRRATAGRLAEFIEEALEASHATADDLPGELADVLEVLRALTVTAGTSWPQLLALAEDKRSRRGGFGRRIFLESVE